ncbi:MAG: hypothetical protein RXN91_04110 [Caldivirga sp.]
MSEAIQIREIVTPAVTWVRKKDEIVLRILGEAEEVLSRHIGETADVAIIDANEREVITFRATISRFISNGHRYIVVFFPKRLAPMIPTIDQLKDGRGRIWLSIRLLGVKKPSRRVEVKEEVRRG